MAKNAIILLSGGLDSLVSLGLVKNDYGSVLALTFDYGQRSAGYEIEASEKIAKYYGVYHKVFKLDWLKNITQTALVNDNIEVPTKIYDYKASMESVWVPNRNGLFLNIAACFADAQCYDEIIIGANKEEGETFSDNSQEFIDRVNSEFEYSTLKKPKVIAPLINYSKNDIVKEALTHKIPLELVKSCYVGGDKHCGKCESCQRLKHALQYNGAEEYLRILF